VGGLGTYVTCQISEFLFFLFFFLFLLSSPRAQVAFLDRSGRSIRQNACFRPRMCPLGVSTISDHIQGVKPKKTSPKLARIVILQPNQRRDKMAIYVSLMNIFVSILTDRLTTWGFNKKCKIRSMGSRGGHVTQF